MNIWHFGVLAEPQRSGSDSKAYQPSAYVRGSVITFKDEATDITTHGTNHGVLAHKAPPVALKGPSVKQKLLQLHAFSNARKAPTSKLAMMDGEGTRLLPVCAGWRARGAVACCMHGVLHAWRGSRNVKGGY